jgi:hypothetical protein
MVSMPRMLEKEVCNHHMSAHMNEHMDPVQQPVLSLFEYLFRILTLLKLQLLYLDVYLVYSIIMFCLYAYDSC